MSLAAKLATARRKPGRWHWTDVAAYAYLALGVVLMVPSLYLLLEGHMAMEPLVGISSLITLLGVLMFAVVIFSPDPATGRAPMAAAR